MNILEYEHYQENKTHGEASFPYITYICSIPLDFSEVMLHWHKEMEFIFIKKGTGRITVDLTTHHVEAGDIIILRPGQLHSISGYDRETMEYENIIFNPEILNSKYPDTVFHDYIQPVLTGAVAIRPVVTSDTPYYEHLADCLNQSDRICSCMKPGYQLAIKACLFNFFYALNLYFITDSAPNSGEKHIEKLKDVFKYIENNYQDPISIEEVSEICNFSQSHFMRFFKNNMGVSFIDYLNDYRLSMACRMLISSDSSILVIASECGYDNLSYFNRLFKKKYGVTPSGFKKSRKV